MLPSLKWGVGTRLSTEYPAHGTENTINLCVCVCVCVCVSLTKSAGQRFLIQENSHDGVFFRDLEEIQIALIETHDMSY